MAGTDSRPVWHPDLTPRRGARCSTGLALVLIVGTTGGMPVVAAEPDPAGIGFFEKKIRPVLVERCYRCHSTQARLSKGGLLLDSREGLRKGGDSGPAVVPGKPDASLLLKAVRYTEETLRMPPKGKLSASVVADFEKWIALGAPDPRLPVRAARKPVDPRAAQDHWAFRPIQAPSAPQVRNTGWPRTPVDRFVLARLEERGLSPAPPADRRTLLRRTTYDLIGLPPTPEEVDAFLADASPDAFARVIDRLLASPHYGERWGRHWLDLARYADTAGETADFPVPQAWRYRNYVIAAFNRDTPYDHFLRAQIAGDILARRLPSDSPRERSAELVTATGYLALARRFGFDTVQDHYLTLEDTIDVLGKSVLGLTVACARCHDHKYDPVSQVDYYALYGIFDSTRYPFPGCEKDKRPRDLVPLRAGEKAYAVTEGSPHNARLHKRGDPQNLGAEVPRRFLQLFGGQPVPADGGSGRLALAGWLTDPTNPLTARVMVNRIWQHHFGTGLVNTPNDFGARGSPPSHPELLDYLASRFIAGGWSIKRLHRLILLSETYRQGSGVDPARVRGDPGNTWLGRFPRRRLSAEEIRDTILAVSADLDRRPGGPHPFPAEKTWQFTQHAPFAAVYDHDHRSVYLMTQRIKRHPFLGLFDGADPNSSTERRDTTTVPTQALFFLNDPFVHTRSVRLAERLLQLKDDDARLVRVYRLCFGRLPTAAERDVAARFLAGYSPGPRGQVERLRRTWAAWVRVLLASNEFLYLD